MYDFIANLLGWLYDVWPSYGGSIILLTLVIMTALAPVTIRQTRSMMAMQRLQPEIKKLKAKHGSDRERMNQEMMALYQANSVNPLGGCLPILVQMPIFLVLFQVVRGLTRRVTSVGLAVGDRVTSATDAGAAEFAERNFNPNYLSDTSQLAADLRASTEMNSLGLDLSQSASGALADNILTGIPYLLLVIGVGVTTWLQQKQIQGRQKSADINPQQQMIMKILPFMLPIFSFGFPAALVVYWFVSNLFRVGQQVFITRKVYGSSDDEIDVVLPAAVEAKKDTKTTNQTARKGATGTASGSRKHGSRSPVSGPPPKKKKKPPSPDKPAAKRSTPEPRTPKERPTSKRVTPKKEDPAKNPRPSRRDKKKR